MIDDSICFLLHDMRGYSYSALEGAGVEAPVPSALAAVHDEYLRASSLSRGQVMAWLAASWRHDVFEEAFVIENGQPPIAIPPYRDFCGCGACEDLQAIERMRTSRWMGQLSIIMDEGAVTFYGGMDQLLDVTTSLETALRLEPAALSSVRRRVGENLLNFMLDGRLVMYSAYQLMTEEHPARTGGLRLRIPSATIVLEELHRPGGGSPITRDYSGTLPVSISAECIANPRWVNIDLEGQHRVSFILSGMLVTGAVFDTRVQTDAYHEAYYSALYEVYMEYSDAVNNASAGIRSSSAVNLESVANLTGMSLTHEPEQCDICNFREEFSATETAQNIKELVAR